MNHAISAAAEVTINNTVHSDDACQIHLGHHFDNARATDAGNPMVLYSLGKAILIGPQVRANNFKARLQGLRVDANTLNGTCGCTLAATYLGTLKGWTSGTGTGQQAVSITEDNLSIGTHIHQQGHAVLILGLFGKNNAGGIGANMTGNTGQHIESATLINC